MITLSQIYDLVKLYEENNDLTSFANSFADIFYDIEKTGDKPAIEAAYQIEAALAGVAAGVHAESSLVSILKSFFPITTYTIVAPTPLKNEAQVTCDPVKALAAGMAVGTATLAYAGIAPSMGFGSAVHLTIEPQTNTGHPQWQETVKAE